MKSRYKILNIEEIPGRFGWYVGIIIERGMACIMVYKDSVRVMYEVAHIDDSDTLWNNELVAIKSSDMIKMVFRKIDCKDLKRWPKWDPEDPKMCVFWSNYVENAKSMLVVHNIMDV